LPQKDVMVVVRSDSVSEQSQPMGAQSDGGLVISAPVFAELLAYPKLLTVR
jgi:hypothetical protein